jgi:hypothetical protein
VLKVLEEEASTALDMYDGNWDGEFSGTLDLLIGSDSAVLFAPYTGINYVNVPDPNREFVFERATIYLSKIQLLADDAPVKLNRTIQESYVNDGKVQFKNSVLYNSVIVDPTWNPSKNTEDNKPWRVKELALALRNLLSANITTGDHTLAVWCTMENAAEVKKMLVESLGYSFFTHDLLIQHEQLPYNCTPGSHSTTTLHHVVIVYRSDHTTRQWMPGLFDRNIVRMFPAPAQPKTVAGSRGRHELTYRILTDQGREVCTEQKSVEAVRFIIRAAMTRSDGTPIRLLSLCTGSGTDLIAGMF